MVAKQKIIGETGAMWDFFFFTLPIFKIEELS